MNTIMQADWRFCRLRGGSGRGIKRSFNSHRESRFQKNGVFAPDASELLSIFPVFGYYLDTVAKAKHGAAITREIESFHACACCIAITKEGKANGGNAVGLDIAMEKHAGKKAIAYPEEGFRAKDHWRFHLGDQAARDRNIFDCFAGERVNRAYKACAQEVSFLRDDTLSFEAAVLKRTMVHFDAMWAEHAFRDFLLKPLPSAELRTICGSRDAFLSTSLNWQGTLVAKDDIVLLNGDPFRVVGCASIDGALALVTQGFTFVRQETLTASRWTPSSRTWDLKWLSAHVLRYAVAWFYEGDTCVILSM